jgi:hypothetical protein
MRISYVPLKNSPVSPRKPALPREALKALIERESARRLVLLAGTMPGLKRISRRRMNPR